nr:MULTISPECIES: MMPL family transporter [unclassified Staphylococcus]
MKFKWPISIAVLLIIILTVIFAPNLSQLAKENGEIKPPDDTTSQQYTKMLKDVGANSNTMVAVINLKEPLKDKSSKQLNDYIDKVKNVKGVDSVISPDENKETFNKMVSKDKKTVMLPIELNTSKSVATADKINKIDNQFDGVYLTNNDLMTNDINKSTDKGLQKTEIVTFVLILVILFIVFRSVVTPFIPLFIVGISYIFGSAIIAILVKYFDFPVSIYIQPFLVALLFGIGTDYCILLLNRFKEELGEHDKTTAVYNTFVHGGKTILLCGLTIFASFLVIFFAKFDLFRSAVGIGIGVICLMIVIYTLLPLILVLLGDKVFWPSKKATSHKDNKLWGKMGAFSIKNAFLIILITLAIALPLIYFVPNKITYDNTNEVSDDYGSVKALNIIKDKFEMGEAFPAMIAIKDDHKLTTSKGLNDLETLSRSINKIDGVKGVNTITRPVGKPIKQLSASDQLNEIQKKLTDANNGLGKVNNGLGTMQNNVQPYTQPGNVQQSMQQASQNPQAATQSMTQQANQLSQGLQQAQQGNKKVIKGQKQIQSYLNDMAKDKNMDRSGMYISDEALKEKQMKKAINQYSEDNGKVVLLNVELDKNPYSKSAFKTLDSIKNTVNNQINQTSFEHSTIKYGGITSQNADLDNTINHDMTKVIILMSLVTFIILVIFKRSIIMPLYMMASILITYYVSMSLANLLFNEMLGAKGILLVVPFFSLVILFSLGIDYAIFLLNRFNEEIETTDSETALMTAMKKMGSVIMTACIIIVGTIAALYTSGAHTLMQIATVLIIGLVIYSLLILPLFIPSIVATLGKGNWWPFKAPNTTKD